MTKTTGNQAITKETIFKQIKKKWYAQGFNCTPLLLGGPGLSGFDVKPTLGDNYKSFLWEFKNEYGKMYYAVDDLERLGKLLVAKIKKEKNYIDMLRKKDQKRQEKTIQDVIAIPEKEYKNLSDKELYNLLRKAAKANRDVGKISHIIEGFSLTADTEIKERLEKYVKDRKKLNKYLSLLSTPTERSFINEREEDLHEIAQITDKDKRKKAIEKHLKKFYWVQNTYAGRVRLTPEEIEKELSTLQYEAIDFAKIEQEKNEALKLLQLDEELTMLLQASVDITSWQDERKKNIFINIDVIEGVIEEIGKRLEIDHKLLRYITYHEAVEGDIFLQENLKETLTTRRAGMIHFADDTNTDGILIGDEYKEFHERIGEEEKKQLETKEFKGMAACTGIAIGKVRVCTSLQAIQDFKEGEVLVASMTRPEYLPAMKKACAIVTDEGGITCHAAIVSRELGIPCIIGTKIATKTLQDGDTVEVKANHGLVIIREKG